MKYLVRYKASIEFDIEVEADSVESAKELSYAQIDTQLSNASEVVFDEINIWDIEEQNG